MPLYSLVSIAFTYLGGLWVFIVNLLRQSTVNRGIQSDQSGPIPQNILEELDDHAEELDVK
jgi:hypothetical protein